MVKVQTLDGYMVLQQHHRGRDLGNAGNGFWSGAAGILEKKLNKSLLGSHKSFSGAFVSF